MTEPSNSLLGPPPELVQRISVAMQSPLWIERVDEATRDRLEAVFGRLRSWADLPDDLRRLLERGEDEVRAGLSPSLYDPSEWPAPPGGESLGSDWAAEDAALDGGAAEAKGVDFDEPDDEPDLPGADDAGWVGV